MACSIAPQSAPPLCNGVSSGVGLTTRSLPSPSHTLDWHPELYLARISHGWRLSRAEPLFGLVVQTGRRAVTIAIIGRHEGTVNPRTELKMLAHLGMVDG
jgi:hypothetical protein